MSSKTENLKKLINIPSVRGHAVYGAPFGTECRRALDFFLELGESMGFSTYNADGYAGHIEYGEGETVVGILAHLDVVPAGQGWSSNPFSAEERNGKIYGRGAMDDKGPAIASLYALKRVREHCEKTGKPLGVKVRLIVGCNEENGSACIGYYKTKINMPDIAFAPDSDFPLINCEQTHLGYEISMQFDGFMRKYVSGIKGGMAHNAVPDYAECRLNKSITPEMLENIKIKGIKIKKEKDGWLITAEGKSAHSMAADEGDNAIFKLIAALSVIAGASEPSNVLDWINTRLCDGVRGTALGIDYSDEVSGRIIVNLVNIDCDNNTVKLLLDMRVPITDSAYGITAAIENLLPPYAEVELFTHSPHLYLPEDCFLVKTLLNVYKEYTGDKDAQCITTGGGTYARTMPNCVAFGATFPGRNYHIHSGDEFIESELLDTLEEIFMKAVLALAEYKK